MQSWLRVDGWICNGFNVLINEVGADVRGSCETWSQVESRSGSLKTDMYDDIQMAIGGEYKGRGEVGVDHLCPGQKPWRSVVSVMTMLPSADLAN